VGDGPNPEHDTFDEFMDMERQRLQEHAQGKLARALGYALPGESQEELERIALEDQRLAQERMVKLKVGEEVSYKHIDELTGEDRRARIAALAVGPGGQPLGHGGALLEGVERHVQRALQHLGLLLQHALSVV
jgi:ribosomal protein S18 acetylase RimI-like enzyme